MEIDCRKYTAKIFTSEYVDGNGVVVGDYLITAAHILDGSKSFELWVDDRYLKVDTDSSLSFQTPVVNGEGNFLDLAIYKLEDLQSPIVFFNGDLNDVELKCIAWRHSVDTSTNKEVWTPFETDAMFIDKKGNFIECMMSDPLIQGYSGCPLFTNGNLVGILYGSGDEGRTCFFMSGQVIKRNIDSL